MGQLHKKLDTMITLCLLKGRLEVFNYVITRELYAFSLKISHFFHFKRFRHSKKFIRKQDHSIMYLPTTQATQAAEVAQPGDDHNLNFKELTDKLEQVCYQRKEITKNLLQSQVSITLLVVFMARSIFDLCLARFYITNPYTAMILCVTATLMLGSNFLICKFSGISNNNILGKH